LLFLAHFWVVAGEGAEISRVKPVGTTLAAAKKEGKVNVYMYRYGKVLVSSERLSRNPAFR